MTHNYIDPLEDLGDRRRVIFYDQLGCRRSDRPDDTSLWTVPHFVRELEAVRGALGLDRFHLFGSSWATWRSAGCVCRTSVVYSLLFAIDILLPSGRHVKPDVNGPPF